MKLFITIFVLAANIFLISCRKTRTCTCEYDSKTTTTKTPRSGGTASIVSTNSSGEDKSTLSNVKKSDFERLGGCNSRTESSVNTYTDSQVISVTTVSSVLGYTYTSTTYTNETLDASSKTETNYDCKVK